MITQHKANLSFATQEESLNVESILNNHESCQSIWMEMELKAPSKIYVSNLVIAWEEGGRGESTVSIKEREILRYKLQHADNTKIQITINSWIEKRGE